MIDNESLRQALATLERHAPAEPDVLVGVRRGIVRRRRRRQAASVLGVAGVAVLVGLGVVLVAPDRGGSPPATSAPAASSPLPNAATPPQQPVLPFTIGAPPAGYTLSGWQISPKWTFAHWAGTGDFESFSVDYSAKLQQGTVIDAEEAVTIGGRPGKLRRFTGNGPGLVDFVWQHDNGWWFQVQGSSVRVGLNRLRAVAESLTPRPAPLPGLTGLGLRAVPDGYQASTWGGNGSTVAHISLCRSAVDIQDNQPHPDCIGLNLKDGTVPAFVEVFRDKSQTPTRIPLNRVGEVGGRPVWATADGTSLYVQFDPGRHVVVTKGDAGPELLRQVASDLVVS